MVQGHTREIGGSKGGWSSRLGSRGAKTGGPSAGRIVGFGDLTSENTGGVANGQWAAYQP